MDMEKYAEKNKPISVIMAAYNAERTISQAIESVLRQTEPGLELVIIDDCSTDRTVDIVRGFQDDRIRLLHNNKNIGAAVTRYYGVKSATGDWIAILDSDDLWQPNKLERQIQVQKMCNADLVFTGSAFIASDGSPVKGILHVP